MINKLVCSLILVSSFFYCNVFAQTDFQELSQQQMKEDFDYFYQELEASYPYFEVNKRLNNIDWLARRAEYEKLVLQSENNQAFIANLEQILNDLNNGHTDFYPTMIYDYFYEAYKHFSIENPDVKAYVEEMEKSSKEKCEYWTKLLTQADQQAEEELSEVKTMLDTEDKDNLQFQFDQDLSVAMLSIHSFSYDLIETDQKQLVDFFKKARNYKTLIIDIRGNTGGDDGYWRNYIVPSLIEKEITYPIVFAFKKSERIRQFKPGYQENMSYKDIDLPNLPSELRSADYVFITDSLSIAPDKNGQNNFVEKYLLVDEQVYSSAESLAYFCKATNFAKVAGERTGGDGIGSDPLLLTLPNSGLVIRFTGEMALNPDGSSNEEVKTTPDIVVKDVQKLRTIKEIMDKL